MKIEKTHAPKTQKSHQKIVECTKKFHEKIAGKNKKKIEMKKLLIHL